MIASTIGRANNRGQTLDLEIQELGLTEQLKGVQAQSQQMAQQGQNGGGNQQQLQQLQQMAKGLEMQLNTVRALKKSAETLYESFAQSEKKEIETTFKNIYA